MIEAIIVAVMVFLSGYAHYDYSNKDCKLEIHSFRIMSKAQITIDKDCAIKAGAADVKRADK